MIDRRIKFLLQVGASAVLIAVALVFVDLRALLVQCGRLRWSMVFLSLVVAGAVWWINARIWRTLLSVQNVQLPTLDLFNALLIGQFYNLFLPGQIAGDVVRGAVVYSGGEVTLSGATSSIVMDRALGFTSMFLVLGCGAFWSPILEPYRGMIGGLIVVVAVVAMAAVLLWKKLGMKLVPSRWRNGIKALGDSLLIYSANPSIILGCLGLSIVRILGMTAIFYLAGAATDKVPSFVDLLFVSSAINIVQTLPVSWSGTGLREFGLMGTWVAAGLPRENGFLASLVVLLATVLYGLAGGMIQLWSGFRSKER